MSARDADAEHAKSAKHAIPLRDALNRARQQEAERSDVIVDLREAELARLELLQDALADVFESIPDDIDLLECSIIPSTPPRLWIDVLAHVVMGRDKRTYRFLKDTRYGRQLVVESTSLEEMASRVTDYVAHRLLERERALESDSEGRSLAGRQEEKPLPVEHEIPETGDTAPAEVAVVADAGESREAAAEETTPAAPVASRTGASSISVWATVLAFLIGMAAGAVGLVAAGLILTSP